MKAPQISEAKFLKSVLILARTLGWSCAHFKTACVQRKDGSKYYATPIQADGKGFPDLVLVRPPRLLFLELKAEGGKLSKEQAEWLDLLMEVPGAEAIPAWPKDWDYLVLLLRGKE